MNDTDTQNTPQPMAFLPSALALLDRLPYAATREQVAGAVAHAMWQAHESGYTAGRGDTLAEAVNNNNDLLATVLHGVVTS